MRPAHARKSAALMEAQGRSWGRTGLLHGRGEDLAIAHASPLLGASALYQAAYGVFTIMRLL